MLHPKCQEKFERDHKEENGDLVLQVRDKIGQFDHGGTGQFEAYVSEGYFVKSYLGKPKPGKAGTADFLQAVAPVENNPFLFHDPDDDNIALNKVVAIYYKKSNPKLFVEYNHERIEVTYGIVEFNAKGGDLKGYIDHQAEIPTDVLKTMTERLEGAIEFLHDQNLVHRDIKPDNILIQTRGDPTSCRLADFGGLAPPDLTFFLPRRGGAIHGTSLPYLSPKLLAYYYLKKTGGMVDDVKIEPVDDWWAFGITMLELVSGKFFMPEGDELIKQKLFGLSFDYIYGDKPGPLVSFLSQLINEGAGGHPMIGNKIYDYLQMSVPELEQVPHGPKDSAYRSSDEDNDEDDV